MSTLESERPAWQRWIVRHLFLYLAIIAGVTVAVSILAARGEIVEALREFPPWLGLGVLALSGLNYGVRFMKWDRLLRDSSIRIDRRSNALIYFACLAMVVTPARLGELYKLVFLRRLHGIATSRSIPPLVLERATDALALLALCAAQPFFGLPRILGVLAAALVLVGMAAALASPATRRPVLALAVRLPFLRLRSRRDRIERLIEGHAVLLRARSFAPNLALSIMSWSAECLGLWLICTGLGQSISFGNATWIYAASTLLGNLTFLPGGLGGTEIALKTLLEGVGIASGPALAATLLVRGATLWFAVFLGLAVTLAGRRRLHWSQVREEAAGESSTA
jgi:uncharacterized protein (TIRG00374 family)